MLRNFFFTCKSCSDSSIFDVAPHDDSRRFKKYFDELGNTLRNDNNDFKNTMMQVLAEFKSEISSCMKDMKTDIMDCRKQIDRVDTSTSSKICALENEVSALHRRLNREDIVVSGLPSGLNNLSSTVLALCKHYNIGVSNNDLNQAFYINDMKLLLVKFNKIDICNALMRELFKTRTLKVRNVFGGDIESRVYLNDHFAPATSKLNSQCRKMQRLKIIAKYKVMNRDSPRALVTLNDGRRLEWDLAECNKYLAGNTNL